MGTLAALAFTAFVSAPGDRWSLVWQDEFDRAEIGEDWRVLAGKASLVDGRLLLEGMGATIGTTRAFAGEVRVEYVARSAPGRPPCDLSVSLCTNPDWGWSPGCLIAFGGNSNQVNQIIWPGGREVDRTPDLLIEEGRTYTIAGERDAGKLTLYVDGKPIISAMEGEDPVAGPGFDRVALVTWTGMLVDRVSVYQHPGSAPPGSPPLPPLPDGDPAEKEAASLARRLGSLDHEEKPGEFAHLADLFAKLAAAKPEDIALAAHARAARELARLRIVRGSPVAAVRLITPGPEGNPYYPKALLYHARYLWWNAAEGGDARKRAVALGYFRALREMAPAHPIVRSYLGEQVPWAEELAARSEGVPAWAADLREAYARQIRILRWWFEHRQEADGQLGGGWGDDVELLRDWVPVAAISTAAPDVVRGIERLCEGVWENCLEDGFDRGMGDVEHSAEPSADTLPSLVLLRYGDPRSIEWNLRSAKTIRERMLAEDRRGQLRFRSALLGSEGSSDNPRGGGDGGYHARVMKHLLWLAWYGNREAERLYVRWARGWLEATMREAHGKPAGVPPGTIWYPSGEIVPPSGAPWWNLDWNYYGWPGPVFKIYDAFLASYSFTGDRAFLAPFEPWAEVLRGAPPAGGEPGSPGWIRAGVHGLKLGETVAQYRWQEGKTKLDDLVLRFANPTTRFRIERDLPAYEEAFARAARGLRGNFALRTSEVIYTDRAGLGGTETTFGAYTGAVRTWGDAGLPTMAVTWIVPDADFAALVTVATPTRLRACVYHFHDEPISIGLRIWQLRPGVYTFGRHEGEPGTEASSRVGNEQVTIGRKGDVVSVPVPPRTSYLLDLTMKEPRAAPRRMPDLAIHERDIEVAREGAGIVVRIPVHNIGSAAAEGVCVRLEAEGSEVATQATVGRIRAPRDFEPSVERVILRLAEVAPGTVLHVTVDPDDRVFEICEENDAVVAMAP
ncbi:MAG: hypothetical protein JXP34_05300 [Planctomycetes bacterium]|nr:hypothetical protein [Planctomycetota bacterium]